MSVLYLVNRIISLSTLILLVCALSASNSNLKSIGLRYRALVEAIRLRIFSVNFIVYKIQ